jgi:hypothetical protein
VSCRCPSRFLSLPDLVSVSQAASRWITIGLTHIRINKTWSQIVLAAPCLTSKMVRIIYMPRNLLWFNTFLRRHCWRCGTSNDWSSDFVADFFQGTIVQGYEGLPWNDDFAWDQLWSIQDKGLNAYTITNLRSGKLLEFKDGQPCRHPHHHYFVNSIQHSGNIGAQAQCSAAITDPNNFNYLRQNWSFLPTPDNFPNIYIFWWVRSDSCVAIASDIVYFLDLIVFGTSAQIVSISGVFRIIIFACLTSLCRCAWP